ncbi:MAG: YfhO family protein [Candidatus Hydrogenedentes bacterium]|nr:YfhO family protein [Candidatus Hydrogenedentota bacterium]
MSPASENRYPLPPLFLAALFFLVAAPLFWTQVEAPRGKAVERAHENAVLSHRMGPSLGYGFERLRNGELPLWNDRQLCGTPWLADPLNGMFQPLNAVFLFMPPGPGLAVQSFLCLFLAGFMFVLFARSLGLRHVPAVLGGVVFAFNGATAAVMSRPDIAPVLVWASLGFWAVNEHCRAPRRSTAVLGGMALALLMFSGSFPAAVAFLCLLAPYAVCRALEYAADAGNRPRGNRGPSPWPGLLLMALLGLLVAAMQLVPAAFWMAGLENPRAALLRADIAGVSAASLPEAFRQMLAPRADLLPRMGYFGVAALAVVPAAFMHREHRAAPVFFFIAGLLSLFAFSGGMSRWVEGFPWPLFGPVTAFCAAVLASLGVDRLMAPRRDPRTPRLWAPMLAVFLAMAALFVLAPAEAKGRIVPVAAALLLFALFRNAWAGMLGGGLIALVLFVDLFTASANFYQHPLRAPETALAADAELIRVVREQMLDGRVLVSAHPLDPHLTPNAGLSAPISAEGGAFLPLTPEESAWWGDLRTESQDGAMPPAGEWPEQAGPYLRVSPKSGSLSRLNMASVRTLVLGEDDAWLKNIPQGGPLRLRRLASGGGVAVLVNDAALPRARLVGSWRVVPDSGTALAVMAEDGFEPERECVIGYQFGKNSLLMGQAGQEGAGGEVGEGTVQISRSLPERVELTCAAARQAVLVLSDTHAPGWKATVNGEDTPVLRVNGRFRGVPVPPGESRVVFVYRPLPVYAGMAVSLATLAVLALAGLFSAYQAVRGAARN